MFSSSKLMPFCRKVVFQSLRNMSDSKVTAAERIASMSATDLVKNTVKVSDWNKKLLVFSGKFKSSAEVPAYLPFETVDRARNIVRIKVANIMMAMTVVGCIYMVYTGKKLMEQGESVGKMNMDWHREYNLANKPAPDKEPSV